jgi:succinate dehydrogenase hydrophobic anchor subunit
MPSFAPWLHNRDNTNDPDLAALQAFAAANTAWPYWSDQRKEFQDAIENANPPNKSDLIATLAQKYGEWKAEEKLSVQRQGPLQWIADNISGLALIIFGLFIAATISIGLFYPRFYATLAKTEQARGLITFLFVLCTSGVIILTAIAIFWMDEKDNIKDRFAYAKDLITIIIGVLGTILGFYFGLQASSEVTMGITNVALSQPIAKTKDRVTFTGQIVGGKGPYTVTILFTDPTGAVSEVATMKKDVKSDTGSISQTIDIPTVSKPGALLFILTARDEKSAQAQWTGMLPVQP